ncbi:MAG: hypothetical protein ACK4IY_07805, partial [Chitinophagales bacterium]
MIISFFLNSHAIAQNTADDSFKPSGKIWGYMFGDLFYKTGGDTLYWGRSEYAAQKQGDLGAKLRRLYFGYDYNISKRWSTRLLLEGTSGTVLPSGQFTVMVKLGYLQYANFLPAIPGAIIKAGLISTPTFAFPEKSWGYRSVEKESLDLRGLGNSVDQGASFEGFFTDKKTGGFFMMVGSGAGNKPIYSKYLEYYLSVHQRFFKNKLNVELMGDLRPLSDESEKILLRGYLSYEIEKLRLGAEISPNHIAETVVADSVSITYNTNPLSLSFFVSPRLTENVYLFLRYDLYNPDTKYNPDYDYTLP